MKYLTLIISLEINIYVVKDHRLQMYWKFIKQSQIMHIFYPEPEERWWRKKSLAASLMAFSGVIRSMFTADPKNGERASTIGFYWLPLWYCTQWHSEIKQWKEHNIILSNQSLTTISQVKIEFFLKKEK